MKRTIFRNLSIVSAIFIVTFSIMLITNYFQVSKSTPLQTEIVETLKELNSQNSGNTELQEQIRQLDLMARRAYFLSMDHLMTGVYILLGMLLVFIVFTRLYFANYRNIPEKDLDPIDEWAIKTRARKYVGFAASGVAAIALLFVVLSTPFLVNDSVANGSEPEQETIVSNEITEDEPEPAQSEEPIAEEPAPAEIAAAEPAPALNEPTEKRKPEKEMPVPTKKDAPPAKTTVPADAVNVINSNAFRGNNSTGISAARNIPAKWNLAAGTNIAWKKPIPMKGNSSPVINGNKVFFTGASESARVLYCYDLNSGEALWELSAENIPGSPVQVPKTTDDTGLASPTVTTDGTQVCAIFATGDLLCADMNGTRLWAKNLGVPDNHYGYASSLITYNGLLLVQWDNQNDSKLIALDIATGAEKWTTIRQERITWSSPIIARVNGKPQIVLMGNPAIAAYNPDNGEQLWRVECLSGEVGASACSANGIIYGASEYATLAAINGADGSVLWQAGDYLPEVSSPVATSGNVYVATSYGVVASYDSKTGQLKKEQEFNAEFYSSPIIADGKIFLFSTDGTMNIFSADDEFQLLDSFETGERTFATPAFTNGRVVVRSEESIYCVTAN
jgi:outer membrane protein assembly factor BamB